MKELDQAPVDLVGYLEQEAIRRATVKRVAGRDAHFGTAEDLVLHKMVSDRPRDRQDAEQIVHRCAVELDREYHDPRVHELADLLRRPSLWNDCRRRLAGSKPDKDR